MAAPATVDISNLSGVWVMNKTLSDNTDDIFQLQGMGWILRKTLGAATITLTVTHTKDDAGVEHIDIDQSLSGLKSTIEKRTLDWTERPHEDYVFGAVVGKSRRLTLDEIDDEKLKEGWTADTIEKGLIESYVTSEKNKWTAQQIWGFMDLNGERRYVRRIKFIAPETRLDKVLVYDFFKSSA